MKLMRVHDIARQSLYESTLILGKRIRNFESALGLTKRTRIDESTRRLTKIEESVRELLKASKSQTEDWAGLMKVLEKLRKEYAES